ncbi:phosphotransferase enzyme family-domain-containing protein [Massariosphaeria phaeospora]|uniref:Phosphotransferase enzyme family-domain-containing protein n=1 Tax=Massariosphaeria phaeospora TaxID=100035 RepID=A0A7C8M9P9_9PLEO|nr:phosphotransferase enzyme family-domain-containing protein [Massariosphaeria phaeospora]
MNANMADREIITDEDNTGAAFTEPDLDDDAVSTTSTIEFEHEPFDTFQEKVLQLCHQDVYPDVPADAIQITRMEGGSYNRVIGITINAPLKTPTIFQRIHQRLLECFGAKIKASKPQEFVIRIPRTEHAWVEHEIAIVRYLKDSGIPVPTIERFDLTKNNAIGERYTIQRLLPGSPAVEAYFDLNTAQQVSFARDLGLALKQMAQYSASVPGTLDPAHAGESSLQPEILRLHCPPRNAFRPVDPNDATLPSEPQTVMDFLSSQFSRQRLYDLSCNREFINPWKQMWPIVAEMDKMGIFDDDRYYLTHMDFFARNMLVEVVDENTSKLSGILDWDEAVFAPAFVNCCPPSWMWDMEGEDEEEELDEAKSNDTPSDPNLQQVKKAFEDAVGGEYLRYAYTPEYRIARAICRLAIAGFHSGDDYNAFEKATAEWNELHPDHAVGGLYDDSDIEDIEDEEPAAEEEA